MSNKVAIKRRDNFGSKRSHRKPILVLDRLASSIGKYHGNLTLVAKQFGVSRTAVQQFIKKNAGLAQVVKDAREGIIDKAESKMLQAINKGEAWAISLTLTTLGKDRGYVKQIETKGIPGPSDDEQIEAIKAKFRERGIDLDAIAAKRTVEVKALESPKPSAVGEDCDPREGMIVLSL